MISLLLDTSKRLKIIRVCAQDDRRTEDSPLGVHAVHDGQTRRAKFNGTGHSDERGVSLAFRVGKEGSCSERASECLQGRAHDGRDGSVTDMELE